MHYDLRRPPPDRLSLCPLLRRYRPGNPGDERHPERLITLLFNGARAAIGQARIHLQEGRVAERGAAISKAIKIVDEGLKTGLNMEAGGDVAANLSRLYDYIVRTLLTANLKSDAEQLDIADRLLADLAEAWQTSIDQPAGSVSP